MITHNLSLITDNLSGFDPVAGQVDGTMIGKNYVMWKILIGLIAFDTQFNLITNTDPTPSWLQSSAGNIQSEPAINSATNSQTLRFYRLDDPGLSQAIPNCIIYEFISSSGNSSNAPIFYIRMRYMASGGTIYAPSNDWNYESYTTTDPSQQICTWGIGTVSGSTATTLGAIPKIIFWKNNTGILIMSIKRTTGEYAGYIYLAYTGFSGYKHTEGAIVLGQTLQPRMGFNPRGVAIIFEGMTSTVSGNYTALPPDLASVAFPGGQLPSGLFTFNSVNNLIASSIIPSLVHNTLFKVSLTSSLEGIIVAHQSAVSAAVGSIYMYNSKYYLHGHIITNGKYTYRILFELGV